MCLVSGSCGKEGINIGRQCHWFVYGSQTKYLLKYNWLTGVEDVADGGGGRRRSSTRVWERRNLTFFESKYKNLINRVLIRWLAAYTYVSRDEHDGSIEFHKNAHPFWLMGEMNNKQAYADDVAW